MDQRSASRHPASTAFLLAQVGAHAAAQFAARLRHLELTPAHAGMLRAITANPGSSQQSLAALLGMVPSRVVPFVDELEQRGIVERRDSPDDRRTYALFITEKGKQLMTQIGRVAREHDAAISAALAPDERAALHALLVRISEQQGLTPGVHPGFSRVDAAPTSAAERSKAKRR